MSSAFLLFVEAESEIITLTFTVSRRVDVLLPERLCTYRNRLFNLRVGIQREFDVDFCHCITCKRVS